MNDDEFFVEDDSPEDVAAMFEQLQQAPDGVTEMPPHWHWANDDHTFTLHSRQIQGVPTFSGRPMRGCSCHTAVAYPTTITMHTP